MSFPRGLSAEEQAAWAKLASSVKPLHGKSGPNKAVPEHSDTSDRLVEPSKPVAPKPVRSKPVALPNRTQSTLPKAPARIAPGNLNSHWDKRLKQGTIAPDFTLDLHGSNLDDAYTRLMRGMAQANAMGARVMLVVTGKPRPVDPADRGTRRGAIRAKILDWLAASEHGGSISAVRKAHRKHGGSGAIYILLRK